MEEYEAKLRLRASRPKQLLMKIIQDQGIAFQAEVARIAKISTVTARQHLEDLVTWKMLIRTTAGKFVFYSVSEFGAESLSEI